MSTSAGEKEQTSSSKPYVALVLQGGGALGAYHVGAYRALHEAGYTPQWVTGVSIGSINAALIAGNKPENQLSTLEEFWSIITRPSLLDAFVTDMTRRSYNMMSAMQALSFGQPNFSRPFFVNPYLVPPGTPAATGIYDNTPLRDTLIRMTDFDLINNQNMRMSLGVTHVKTGNLVFFDNTDPSYLPIEPEHVISSSSIPPMYPGTKVKGELYWDGGIVANTPLEPVLDDQDKNPSRHTLVFMIDLWDGYGDEPETMDEVMWRYNAIQFASRTDRHINEVIERDNLRRRLKMMEQKLVQSESEMSAPTFPEGTVFDYGNLDIVRIIYHPTSDKTSLSYVDFSPLSIADRQKAGYEDMRFALDNAPWFDQSPTPAKGAVAFSVDKSGRSPSRAAVHHIRQREITSKFPGYM